MMPTFSSRAALVEVPSGNLAELNAGQGRAELIVDRISTGSASGAGVMISARSIGIRALEDIEDLADIQETPGQG